MKEGVYEIKREDFEGVNKLLVNGFLEINQIWASSNLQHQQIRLFFSRELQVHLESQERARKYMGQDKFINHAIFGKGILLSCIIHIELEQYRQMKRKEATSDVALFAQLEQFGKQLTKNINFDSYPKGKTLYCTFGARSEQEIWSTQLKIKHFLMIHNDIRRQGFHTILSRLSNRGALGLYLKIGAKVLSELKFTKNGKQNYLYFIELDLRNQKLDKLIKMFIITPKL